MYFILIGPFCFGLFVFHLALGANFLFGTKCFCLYIRSGTVRLQEPALCPKHVIVIAVRDRSAPEPVLFRNELFSVYGRDHLAPGAWFCLKTIASIGVCGPGAFGSGILFFVWNEFFVGSSQEAGFFFCLEWKIIVCGLTPLGSGTLYWSYIRSGTVSS